MHFHGVRDVGGRSALSSGGISFTRGLNAYVRGLDLANDSKGTVLDVIWYDDLKPRLVERGLDGDVINYFDAHESIRFPYVCSAIRTTYPSLDDKVVYLERLQAE